MLLWRLIIGVKVRVESEMEDEFIEITILKFNKIVPRKDIKCPQWFSMECDILVHPDFLDINGNEFKAYVWMLGVAAKLNTKTIRVYPLLFERLTGIDKKVIIVTIGKLTGKRLGVKNPNVARTQHEHGAYATRQDKTRQDKTLEAKASFTEPEKPTPAMHKKSTTGVLKINSYAELLELIGEKRFFEWVDLYPDRDWVEMELKKSFAWYVDAGKGRKTERGWKQSFSSWLARGWDRRREPNQSTNFKTKGGDVSASNAALFQKINSGSDQ